MDALVQQSRDRYLASLFEVPRNRTALMKPTKSRRSISFAPYRRFIFG